MSKTTHFSYWLSMFICDLCTLSTALQEGNCSTVQQINRSDNNHLLLLHNILNGHIRTAQNELCTSWTRNDALQCNPSACTDPRVTFKSLLLEDLRSCGWNILFVAYNNTSWMRVWIIRAPPLTADHWRSQSHSNLHRNTLLTAADSTDLPAECSFSKTRYIIWHCFWVMITLSVVSTCRGPYFTYGEE